ncbi:MAG: ribose 5-phosphate isomerase B [Lachnospiraceae bacterium]|nr:ribose 5-phosphate isomerase B [Lachnospiraceae bacterium]
MKVAIGSDHGGFDMKEAVIAHLKEKGYEVTDVGCYDRQSCDYPPYGRAVAHAVADGKADKGIVICTTGIGISITANKVKGIRAGLCHDTTSAYLTRAHNDANVLAMGAGLIGIYVALDIVDTFLETEFSGLEKHARRVAAIEE